MTEKEKLSPEEEKLEEKAKADPTTTPGLIWRLLRSRVGISLLFVGYILGLISGAWITLEIFDSVVGRLR